MDLFPWQKKQNADSELFDDPGEHGPQPFDNNPSGAVADPDENYWLKEYEINHLNRRVQELKNEDPSLDDEKALKIAAIEISNDRASQRIYDAFDVLSETQWESLRHAHPHIHGALKFLARLAAGSILSTGIKVALSSTLAAVPAAAIAGGIAGGVTGALQSRDTALHRQFSLEKINTEINLQDVYDRLEIEAGKPGYVSTEELAEKIQLYEQLLEQHKILGDQQEIRDLRRKLAALQQTFDERRFLTRYEQVDLAERTPEKIAEILMANLDNKIAGSGLEQEWDNLSEKAQQFIEERMKIVNRATWMGGAIGTAVGFVTAGLLTKILSPVNGFGGGHYNPETAANYAVQHNPDFKSVISDLMRDGRLTDSSMHLLYQNGVDMSKETAGWTLRERVEQTAQWLINQGVSSDKAGEIIYHVLSHPESFQDMTQAGLLVHGSTQSDIHDLIDKIAWLRSSTESRADYIAQTARLGFLASSRSVGILTDISTIALAEAAALTSVPIAEYGKAKREEKTEEEKKKEKEEKEKKDKESVDKKKKELKDKLQAGTIIQYQGKLYKIDKITPNNEILFSLNPDEQQILEEGLRQRQLDEADRQKLPPTSLSIDELLDEKGEVKQVNSKPIFEIIYLSPKVQGTTARGEGKKEKKGKQAGEKEKITLTKETLKDAFDETGKNIIFVEMEGHRWAIIRQTDGYEARRDPTPEETAANDPHIKTVNIKKKPTRQYVEKFQKAEDLVGKKPVWTKPKTS